MTRTLSCGRALFLYRRNGGKGKDENGTATGRIHLRGAADEKKMGQTSDVFKNALKRFKALKCWLKDLYTSKQVYNQKEFVVHSDEKRGIYRGENGEILLFAK